MKIGLISYYYPSKKENCDNGVAIHVFYLSRELAKLGCEVHVFTAGDKSTKEVSYLGEGKLVVHRLPIKLKSPPKDPVIFRRMGYLLFDNLVTTNIATENSTGAFDVIHSHGWLTTGPFMAKYFNGIKWIHTFHSLEKNRISFLAQEEKKYFNIVKWIESTINNADALISVTKNLKEETEKNYNVKEKRFYVVPNGVDLNLFNPSQKKGRDKMVLFLGRFSMEKGIEYLPGIIRRVFEKNDSVTFEILAPYDPTIAGMDKIKSKIEFLISEYPKRIIWHKKIKSRQEIKDLISEATISIQPSKYEAFGMTALESMACGKLPIVSDRGGLPEVVGNAGIVCPLDEESFSEAILKLLKDYRLRERYSRRGIQRVKDFDWPVVSQKVLLVYKKICGKLKKGEDKYGITESKSFNNHPSL